MPMAPGLNRRLKNIEEGSKGGLNSDSLLLDNMTESQLGKGTVGSRVKMLYVHDQIKTKLRIQKCNISYFF
jgi:hypothetical protein